MPGTIHVSVLDFEGQQASSGMSIKISLGKREYQSKDKGEFSFPLTSLRDNLIVTLQDVDGKEVSHTGVQTRMVIEKGVWDDLFPLDGGWHVHLRLQFLLSEEDRQRIRATRQSALIKKHRELTQREIRSPKEAIVSGANADTSFPHSNEASGPSSPYVKKSLLQKDVANLFEKGKRGPGDREATYLMPKKESLCDEHIYEKIPSTTITPQQLGVLPVSSAGVETRTSAAAAENKGPLEMKRHNAHDSENQIPPEETPSNVRNVKSIFESRLNQDKRPQMRSSPIPIASQSIETKAEVHLKSSYSDELKISQYGLAKPLSGKPGDPVNIWKGNEIGFVGAFSGATATENIKQLQESRAAFDQTKEIDEELNGTKTNVKPKYDASDEEQMLSEDVVRASTGRRASVSGQAPNEQPGTDPFSNFFSRKRYSSSNLSAIKSGEGANPKGSNEMSNTEISADKHYRLEMSGAWIFPDEGKRLCITTADKRIMDLMGGFLDERDGKSEQMASSVKANLRKIMHSGALCKAEQAEQTTPKLRKSTVEDPNDGQTSKGLLGQVMKVAIMVGFATLVIFTRQRNPDSR